MRRWLIAAVAGLGVAFMCARIADSGDGCVLWVEEGTVMTGGTGHCESWRMTKYRNTPSLSCEHWLRVKE